MKNLIIILIALIAFSCDENEVMPSYQKKGTATATVVTIVASKTAPLAGETITLTMEYVNPQSDPVQSITLRAKVGAGTYETISTLDETSAEKNVKHTRQVNYDAPAAGTTVTFEMILSSGKEFPQIKRTSITAK